MVQAQFSQRFRHIGQRPGEVVLPGPLVCQLAPELGQQVWVVQQLQEIAATQHLATCTNNNWGSCLQTCPAARCSFDSCTHLLGVLQIQELQVLKKRRKGGTLTQLLQQSTTTVIGAPHARDCGVARRQLSTGFMQQQQQQQKRRRESSHAA
jgi:hypothetical protein